MKIVEHWLDVARKLPSPNQNDRPSGMEISLIVIHSISLPPDEYGGPWIDRLFTNRLHPDEHPYFEAIANICVSAHVLVRRDGGITQYVAFDKRAWHAGESSFRGRTNCNDFSVGIELEGSNCRPYTETQYRQLARLVTALMETYPTLARDRIAGHSDIAPGRKQDPGPAFQWLTLFDLLDARNADPRAGIQGPP